MIDKVSCLAAKFSQKMVMYHKKCCSVIVSKWKHDVISVRYSQDILPTIFSFETTVLRAKQKTKMEASTRKLPKIFMWKWSFSLSYYAVEVWTEQIPDKTNNKIVTEGKTIMGEKATLNKMLINGKNSYFITLTNHKKKCLINLKTRLLNTTKMNLTESLK